MAEAAFPPGPRAPALLQGVRYTRSPLSYLSHQRERYGDVFSARYPSFDRMVYVADPALVKQVFTGNPSQFHAGEANATVLEPAVGPKSVLVLDDDEHMRQRKLLLPPFHGERVRRYGDLMREIAEREMETWPVGRAFSARDHTVAITLEVILRAVFGLREAGRLALAREVVGEFARRSHRVVLYPFLRKDLGRFSPWARFKRARAELDAFIYEEIAARRKQPDAEERDDVLSLMLGATHEDGTPMTDTELRDELVTVIGAGHETTATSLAWALERLLRTPAVLERARAAAIGDDDDYLDAVVKETLRARPVITEVARKLTEETEIGGYRLPAGTFVSPAITALHFRADLFPDPRMFRPERFLEGEGDTYSWIPFGGGVRRCLGAAFAQYEMRVVLSTILRRADLRAERPEPEPARIRNITLAPERGARVVLEAPLRSARELSATLAAAS